MTTQFTRRTMLKRSLGAALGGAAIATGVSLNNAAAQRTSGTGINVVGTVTNVATNVTTAFEGVLNGLTATLDDANGAIDIAGTISGLLNGVQQTTTFTASIVPDSLAGTSCDILNLDLGPLDLNLLGLVVHLDPIVLDVTAEPGPGNLLGNLLCAVAGLLDNGASGPLTGLTNLLNKIFALLG